MNLVAAIITWAGCLAPYLSSEHQKLLPNTLLSKAMAWPLSALSFLVSAVILSQAYHPVSASLLTLIYIMTFWCCLILCGPHAGGRFISLNALALGLIVLFTGVL